MIRYVYGIRFGQYLKVGCSIAPGRRLIGVKYDRIDLTMPAELTNADRDDSEPIFAVVGDFKTETLIQVLLADWHLIGEWFVWTDGLRKVFTDLDKHGVFGSPQAFDKDHQQRVMQWHGPERDPALVQF